MPHLVYPGSADQPENADQDQGRDHSPDQDGSNKDGGNSGDGLRYQQRQLADSDELMQISLRYRQPSGGASRELRQVLAASASPGGGTAAFRWAANVAEFALLMTDSDYAGNASLSEVIRRSEALAMAGSELQREFVGLVRQAQLLRQSAAAQPHPGGGAPRPALGIDTAG